MSLSTALHSALSGLTVAGRASGVVSENISNALTPGYARRSLELAARTDGSPGVRIVGVNRHIDPGIVANRRAGDAEFANADSLANAYARISDVIGSPDEAQSLAGRLAAFESTLITAASQPESSLRLDASILAAKEVTGALNGTTSVIQSLRGEADRRIGAQVDRLNTTLAEVQTLNAQITATAAGGGRTASLIDLRQGLIDEINTIVPVKAVTRQHGQVALYTSGGAILLDGTAARLSFTRTNTITPEMTLESGGLLGLSLNGQAINTDSETGPLAGGACWPSSRFATRSAGWSKPIWTAWPAT